MGFPANLRENNDISETVGTKQPVSLTFKCGWGVGRPFKNGRGLYLAWWIVMSFLLLYLQLRSLPILNFEHVIVVLFGTHDAFDFLRTHVLVYPTTSGYEASLGSRKYRQHQVTGNLGLRGGWFACHIHVAFTIQGTMNFLSRKAPPFPVGTFVFFD